MPNLNPFRMTNATKGGLIGLLNAGMLLARAFNVPVDDAQMNALGLFANAVLLMFVGATKDQSPSRQPQTGGMP